MDDQSQRIVADEQGHVRAALNAVLEQRLEPVRIWVSTYTWREWLRYTFGDDAADGTFDIKYEGWYCGTQVSIDDDLPDGHVVIDATPATIEEDHDHKGYSEEKCTRCGWVMGHRPLNCNNDSTPHVFPSQIDGQATEGTA